MLSDYKNSTHYVIDIETLGIKPGCPILQIAAVQVQYGEIKQTMQVPVSVASCKKYDLWNIDEKTVKWWMSEHPETFLSVLSDSIYGKALDEALEDLIDFCIRPGEPQRFLWAKHPMFDFLLLESALKNCDFMVPWKYWEIRDIATLEDKFFLKSEQQKNSHNALEDATNEAQTLIQAIWPEKNE